MKKITFLAVCFVFLLLCRLQTQEIPYIELKGHTGIVYYVAFSPDGKKIVTAGTDKTYRFVHTGGLNSFMSTIVTGTARIWDAEGKELRKLEGHTNAILSVAFSPDGKKIVTGSFDKTARTWDTESGKRYQSTSM